MKRILREAFNSSVKGLKLNNRSRETEAEEWPFAPGFDSRSTSGADLDHFPSRQESHTDLRLPADDPFATNGSSSIFKNAHDFVLNGATFVENHQGADRRAIVLEKLADNTIPGAEYDSSARDPPPSCHPGTRMSIIQDIKEWRTNASSGKKLLWMHGPPGVGKSAIIQSVAELEAEVGILGATLFFSRSMQRDKASLVWPTIAYQLAVKEPSYLAYLSERIERDPKLLEKGIREQFKTLIVEPFAQSREIQRPQPLSVFLDGLDECHDESAQTLLVQLISEFVQNYPSAPLIWVIASRPEEHLKVAFEEEVVQRGLRKISVPVDSDEACADVEKYLRKSFVDIRKKFPYAVAESTHWPRESDILAIVKVASGLFVFATAIIRFVEDPLVGDPVSQLELIIPIAQNAASAQGGQINPLAILHLVFDQILGLIPPSIYSTTKRLLGFHLLRRDFTCYTLDSASFWEVCNTLSIKQNVAYSSLHRLHSVLIIPNPENASRVPLKFFHTSFSDYLKNPYASKKFCIKENEVATDLWRCRFQHLQEANISTHPLPNPYEIKLAWSANDQARDKHLRLNLWSKAQGIVLHYLLPGICPFGGCVLGNYHQALSELPSFAEVLAQIDFRKLVDGYEVPEVRERSPRVLDWLTSGEGSQALLDDGLLRRFNLSTDPSYSWVDRTMVSYRIKCSSTAVLEKTVYTDSVLDFDELNIWLRLTHPLSTSNLKHDLSLHQDHISSSFLAGSRTAGRAMILLDEESYEGVKVFYFIPYTTPRRHRGRHTPLQITQ